MSQEHAPIADPGPLGLAGFAATTFILSAVNAGLITGSLAPIFLTLGLFYGGLAQVLAGMWEFKKNNTFGATAFTSYGAFWLSLATLVILEITKVITFGAAEGTAVGWFLLAWTIFTFYMWIGSFRTNKALAGVFSALIITFVLLTVGALGGVAIATKSGGYFGLLTALLAWYASAAGVINSVAGRTVLSVGARKQIAA